MSFKKVLLTLLSVFVFTFSLLTLSQSSVLAETTCPSPIPSGSPVPSNWVYEVGGLTRHRTLTTYYTDGNEGDCGFIETTETQYSYCVQGEEFSQSGWYTEGQQPEGATPGQCEGDPLTMTVCIEGQTVEVEIGVARQNEYTEGACVDPSPTPPSCSENQHLDASGMKCVEWSQSGGGDNGGGSSNNSGGGQVLGASTSGSVLAATGNTENIVGLSLIVLGLGISGSSIYAYSKNKYN